MKTGDAVMWCGMRFRILAEYDDEYVYIDIPPDGAQLVHKGDLVMLQ